MSSEEKYCVGCLLNMTESELETYTDETAPNIVREYAVTLLSGQLDDAVFDLLGL